MTTTAPTDFVSQLLANVEEYKDSVAEEYISSVREEATEYFLQKLLTSDEAKARFEENALHRSKTGAPEGRPVTNMTVPVHTWQGRSESYKEVALSDLLDRDDLLTRMQDWINATYGENKLRIFNHQVRAFNNQVRNSRETRLTVSWNKDGFDKIDEIIEKNRVRAQRNVEKQRQRREDGPSGDRDDDHRRDYDRDDRRRDYDRADRTDRRPWREGGGGGGPRRDYRPRRDYDDRRPRRDYDDRRPRRDYDDRRPRRDYDRDERSERGRSRRDESETADSAPAPSRRSLAVSSYEE